MSDTHPHECPQCGRRYDCDEGGWHAIDYRLYYRCPTCLAAAEQERGGESPAEAKAS